ncbi:MAG: sigma-70 family RNA polymerase sigma factor [Paludisphaera borealis]|uniref:sigma-70 family RNA polymerase sigma factor n=1 Tax=Paludisphaera borealis TaxID=1387353 RepID=UPI00284BCD97|nr:sigma-70 family RNA polymerase sigma factor [Paludisphaera borealis]MDR3621508.1 sigma-70 family RNA polymerase sigma factor [Paludisphaera borealis]
MLSTRPGDVVRNLNVLLRDGTAGGLNDGQLLSRFLASGDETAFSILVERHGPVVMRVCRSILGPMHDPQDAFQATFLVLVKRARSLQDHASVGPWLVGVSYRIATRAKIDAFRRSIRERRAAESRTDAISTITSPSCEVWPELYEELGRLPGKFRDPLVLCYLEGHTAEQAAERLGCPRGTILSRMARAKERLKDQLTRRGVTVSDAALIAGLSPASASAPLPIGLAAVTTRAAVKLAQHASLAGIVTLARSTVVASILIVAAFATFGLTLAAKPRPEDPTPPQAAAVPPQVAKPPASKEVPKPGPTKLLTVETRDLTTGSPVPGIEIKLNVIGTDQKWLKATSDENGLARFQLSLPGEIKYLQPFASREGFVPLGLNWNSDPSSSLPDRFLLQLEKATTIKGRVIDDGGRPIASATVVIDASKRYPGSPQWVAVSYEKVQTDADGRWSFTGVPEKPDAVKLAVYHHLHLDGQRFFYNTEEFKPLSALQDGSALLHLRRGTPVNGTVVAPDGKPVAGATVYLGESSHFVTNEIPPVVTDADGKFALGLRAGTATSLTVLSPGYAPTQTMLRVGTAPVPVSIALQPPHRLEGRLVDAQGKPITKAAVEVDAWKGFEGIRKTLHPDADGKFVWEDAPADEVRMRVSAIGYSEQRSVAMTAGSVNRVVLTAPTTVRGTVLDDETGKPISGYSLLVGVVWGPNDRLIWQRGWDVSRDAKRSERGFEHTFTDSVHQYLIRVEAPGYAPADSGHLESGTNHDVTFRLKKADPIRGVVTRPDGSTAREGFVYLVLESDSLRIDNGKAKDYGVPMTVHSKIGAEGSFSLPPQIEPYVLVALSPEGIGVDDRRKGKAGALHLEPWAKLSGRLSRDGKPLAGAVLRSELNAPLFAPEIPMLSMSVYLTTDAQGRFTLDRLTPGRQVFHRRVPNNTPKRDWFIETATLDAKPGASYNLNIGASGHPVVGKLALPPGRPWMIRKSIIEAKGGDASAPKYGIEVAADGRFRADDVPAGDYVMRIALHEPPPENACGWGALVAAFSHEFKVVGEGELEPVDLGVLSPIESHERPIEVGQAAPDFDVKTMDGKDLSLDQFKGKYVLLDFWATWCAPCAEEIPNLKAAHERFAGDPRFAMISLSLDEKPDDALYFVKSQKMTWLQSCVGPESAVVADYGASAIPQTILIAPDGRVIAKDLRGKRIEEAIAEAMKK